MQDSMLAYYRAMYLCQYLFQIDWIYRIWRPMEYVSWYIHQWNTFWLVSSLLSLLIRPARPCCLTVVSQRSGCSVSPTEPEGLSLRLIFSVVELPHLQAVSGRLVTAVAPVHHDCDGVSHHTDILAPWSHPHNHGACMAETLSCPYGPFVVTQTMWTLSIFSSVVIHQ